MKKYLQTLAIILTVVLISSVMNASILSFGVKLFLQHILLGYTSSIAYGFIASKIAIEEDKSTLLLAILALIYALTLPAWVSADAGTLNHVEGIPRVSFRGFREFGNAGRIFKQVDK